MRTNMQMRRGSLCWWDTIIFLYLFSPSRTGLAMGSLCARAHPFYYCVFAADLLVIISRNLSLIVRSPSANSITSEPQTYFLISRPLLSSTPVNYHRPTQLICRARFWFQHLILASESGRWENLRVKNEVFDFVLMYTSLFSRQYEFIFLLLKLSQEIIILVVIGWLIEIARCCEILKRRLPSLCL